MKNDDLEGSVKLTTAAEDQVFEEEDQELETRPPLDRFFTAPVGILASSVQG